MAAAESSDQVIAGAFAFRQLGVSLGELGFEFVDGPLALGQRLLAMGEPQPVRPAFLVERRQQGLQLGLAAFELALPGAEVLGELPDLLIDGPASGVRRGRRALEGARDRGLRIHAQTSKVQEVLARRRRRRESPERAQGTDRPKASGKLSFLGWIERKGQTRKEATGRSHGGTVNAETRSSERRAEEYEATGDQRERLGSEARETERKERRRDDAEDDGAGMEGDNGRATP